MQTAQSRGFATERDLDRDSLELFVADVEGLRREHPDDRALADAVSSRLARLVRAPSWLCETHREPWDDRYRQHLLHVAPDGGFSVVALVWKPGQRTPIHDHVSWCVVGVYRGAEEEVSYRLYRGRDEQFLVEVGRQVATPGQTVALVPPDEDIHVVTNVGDGLAISIHVYGADIGKLGSSINRRFDDAPIRAEAGAAHPVRWRAT